MSDELRQELSAKIKDAYYHARDNGGTMHTAADDAADALLPIFERHLARERIAIESQIADHVAIRERAARAGAAEQIAAAIENVAEFGDLESVNAGGVLRNAVRIARQHAEEVGSDE